MDPLREWDMYEIKVAGVLEPSWAEWFGEMAITTEFRSQEQPVTILAGRIADQAYMRGILCKLWDLNFRVISVVKLDRPEQD